MDEWMAFHFLRPWWLVSIPLLLALVVWTSRQQQNHTGFEQWIDAHLLAHIVAQPQVSRPSTHRQTYYLLAFVWTVIAIALAGPTWKELPQALHQSKQAMIVVLDLSPSMLAEDNKPSRIVRARLKIQDLLSQRKGGLTAMVVYSGEAHTVSPLTDDTNTIINLLPTLSPGLLPIPGSNIEMAAELSKTLISDAGLLEASVVIVTDGIVEVAIDPIKKTLGNNIDVFIIGIGTEKGAPIPSFISPSTQRSTSQSDFLRDDNNQIVNAVRDEVPLKALATATNGYYLPLQADNSDVAFIIKALEQSARMQTESADTERNADQWEEFGPILVLLLLPFAALMFRRGWLLSTGLLLPLVAASTLFIPQPASALSWDELWLNDDQRGEKALTNNEYEKAQSTFTDPQWQGGAAYRNKNYEQAIDAFGEGDTATDHYNRGNALGQLGRYDEALSAYDTALQKDPNFEDAKNNKKIIQQIKEQEQQDSKDGEKSDQDQESDSKENNEGKESKENNEKNSEGNEENASDEKNNQQNDPADQKNAGESEALKEKEKEQGKEGEKGEEQPQSQITQEQQDALAHLSKEERQELEQWLRKVPDDPSGLLRRKFQYEFKKRRQLYQSGQWTLPDNGAHKRY